MAVLAFDTCFTALSVAVRWKDREGRDHQEELFEDRAAGHAERLMPAITEVLARTSLSLKDVHRIGVTRGPGSFTGLRVGIACARALALALHVPVVAMSSLEVIAREALTRDAKVIADGRLIVAMDARKDAVYAQSFLTRPFTTSGPAQLLSLEELAKLVVDSGATVVGSAGPLLSQKGLGATCVLHDLKPHARQIAQCASLLEPVVPLTPVYLRSADAKLPSTTLILGARPPHDA